MNFYFIEALNNMIFIVHYIHYAIHILKINL